MNTAHKILILIVVVAMPSLVLAEGNTKPHGAMTSTKRNTASSSDGSSVHRTIVKEEPAAKAHLPKQPRPVSRSIAPLTEEQTREALVAEELDAAQVAKLSEGLNDLYRAMPQSTGPGERSPDSLDGLTFDRPQN